MSPMVDENIVYTTIEVTEDWDSFAKKVMAAHIEMKKGFIKTEPLSEDLARLMANLKKMDHKRLSVIGKEIISEFTSTLIEKDPPHSHDEESDMEEKGTKKKHRSHSKKDTKKESDEESGKKEESDIEEKGSKKDGSDMEQKDIKEKSDLGVKKMESDMDEDLKHLEMPENLLKMIKDLRAKHIPGTKLAILKRIEIRLFALKFIVTTNIMGQILKCLQHTDERKDAYDILWNSVTDKDSLRTDFIEDFVITTKFQEGRLDGVNKAQLLFQLNTFLLSLAATATIAVTAQLPPTELVNTLEWIAFGFSMGSTICKALDSGALPIVANYYVQQIKAIQKEVDDVEAFQVE